MLRDSSLTAVLPVSDLERAVGFYRDQLGLTDGGQEPGGNHIFRLGGGATIGLMPAEDGAQTQHTVVSFEVQDIVGEIRDLEGRGVTFHDYDSPGLTTTDHVASTGGEKAAWFSDTEGNILCLHENTSG